MINYFLVIVLTSHSGSDWKTMRIVAPYKYVTECYAKGRALHEQHIKKALKVGRFDVTFVWDCRPFAHEVTDSESSNSQLWVNLRGAQD